MELVGIEPATGLPVRAMAVSPWIAPKRNQGHQFQVSRLGLLAFCFHSDTIYTTKLLWMQENSAPYLTIFLLWYSMSRDKTWRWEFLGFRSQAEGRPVQVWFRKLLDEDKDEIVYWLGFLQNYIERPWPEFAYDPLNGEGGISEIRFPEMRRFRDGEYKVIVYRIYGWFGPEKRCYTFLHGTDKDVRNDQIGKQIARIRLEELRRKAAGVYKFEFEEESDSETEEEPRRPN